MTWIPKPDKQAMRILGFRVGVGDPRARQVIPVDPGLTVLYGLNGAGKTRILRSISDFYAGRYNDAIALVQLPNKLKGEVDWRRERPEVGWATDWGLRLGVDRETCAEDVVRHWAYCSFGSDDPDHDFPLHRPRASEERNRGMAEEWRRDRLIWVRAWGSVREPLWRSGPAVIPGPRRPFANEAARLSDQFDAAEGDDELALQEAYYVLNAEFYGVGPDGCRILAAANRGEAEFDEKHLHVWATSHVALPAMTPRLVQDPEDVHDATRIYLSNQFTDDEVVEVSDGVAGPTKRFREVVARIEASANGHFAAALRGAPQLRLYTSVTGLDDSSLARRRIARTAVRPFLREPVAEPRWAKYGAVEVGEVEHRSCSHRGEWRVGGINVLAR